MIENPYDVASTPLKEDQPPRALNAFIRVMDWRLFAGLSLLLFAPSGGWMAFIELTRNYYHPMVPWIVPYVGFLGLGALGFGWATHRMSMMMRVVLGVCYMVAAGFVMFVILFSAVKEAYR